MTAPAPLSASIRPLAEVYNALLSDLDGVIYLDDEPVPAAVAGVAAARQAGMHVVFVTNNAAHTPDDVVARLTHLGIAADTGDVVTSSMAAADLLADELPAGSDVLVVGGRGLWAAVESAGFHPVADVTDSAPPRVVVQGWGPDVGWSDLAEATVALRAGARWIVTNLDRTLPSPRGPLPGSGSLVAAVRTAVGREPDAVAGKPYPALFAAARSRVPSAEPLVVGDRLDTDIGGATRSNLPSLFVLTGVSRPRDLLAAPAEARPTYLGRDLSALRAAHPAVDPDGTVHRAAGDTDDGLDGLRSLAVRAWHGELPTDQYDAALAALDLS